MKVVTFLFALLLVVGIAKAQTNETETSSETMTSESECPETYTPTCYCSSSSVNQNCDVTQRITQSNQNTTGECQDFCVSTCGEGAGFSFSCEPTPLVLEPCNSEAGCKCSCGYNGDYPSPIQFGAQCSAFCARDDVCGSGAGGGEYSCPKSDSGSSGAVAYSAALVLPVVAIACVAFFM